MVYTPDGRVASFQAVEYRYLVASAVEKATREATEAATKKNMKAAISKALRDGRSIEDILKEL